MVHNGIEYGDMQLVGEAYQLLKDGMGLSAGELEVIFTEWNREELDRFLIEISAPIFRKKDDNGQPMFDKILDTTGKKCTGKWTAIDALDNRMPVTLIGESVLARCISLSRTNVLPPLPQTAQEPLAMRGTHPTPVTSAGIRYK
jgi:6-phosphogluconate dehydrogenase